MTTLNRAILALSNGFPPLVLVLRPYPPHLLCAAPNLPLVIVRAQELMQCPPRWRSG